MHSNLGIRGLVESIEAVRLRGKTRRINLYVEITIDRGKAYK